MNHANTNRAPVVALFVPLLIAFAAACTANASGPSSAASSAPSAATATASPAVSAPATASPAPATASPTARPTVSPTARPPASDTTVKIGVRSSTKLGSYLTGPNGRTLYTLSSDPKDKSTCAGQCATAWPPLKIASNGKVESTSMGTFEIIKRADGTDQIAFDGHPLYEFIKDTAAGQTNGEGIVAFGGTWHVAKAN